MLPPLFLDPANAPTAMSLQQKIDVRADILSPQVCHKLQCFLIQFGYGRVNILSSGDLRGEPPLKLPVLSLSKGIRQAARAFMPLDAHLRP